MTIKAKAMKVLTWALGAVLVSAGVAWAATLWRVDSYGNIRAARSSVLLSAGQTSNCKLDVTGTTLSVVGQNDAALSVSNPCLVGLNDGSVATFTAPVSVTFGAGSQTTGNLWGIQEANWADATPFFLGVISDGSSQFFTIGPMPNGISGSAAADLCQLGDTNCDDFDEMILTTGLALGSWVDKPITQVGWFAGTYATATTSWTFVLSGANYIAGFNDDYKDVWWTMPLGQGGADANRYFFCSGGGTTATWATYANIVNKYRMSPSGEYNHLVSTSAAGNATNGNTANLMRAASRYKRLDSAGTGYSPGAVLTVGGAGWTGAFGSAALSSSSTTLTLYSTSTSGAMSCNSFSNTADDMVVDVTFKVTRR